MHRISNEVIRLSVAIIRSFEKLHKHGVMDAREINNNCLAGNIS